MSFRIDDILRKGSPPPPPPKCNFSCESPKSPASYEAKPDPWYSLTPESTNSILHQTLLNRTYPYYRSVSECSSAKLYSSLYNCDKMYLPYNHLDPYVDKVSAFSSVYSRGRYWPMYHPSTLPVVLPLPYGHYSKRKGGQVRFTASQTDALEKRFNSHKYLSPEDRRILADSLKLSDRQVKTWFQNRRAKWRRCNSNSSNSQSTEINDGESDAEPDICDDTPQHEKSISLVK